ncbi:creatininase [Parvibaculum sp.]|uniref:creatininase n=1 Tax=Parvibaculum sp. TaxID=2024848 RepID=UPI0026008A52|nr:creatininase [Parvibaculum sp.]
MTVLMQEMSWPAFEEKTKALAPFFLPVGATEQHGPHLPLGTDAFLPTHVAKEVAARVGGVVAPAIPYGYKSQPRSGGGQHFPGTTSLAANTLTLVVRDVIHDLGLHGARRFVVVNGHVENAWPVIEGIDLALRELRRDGIDDAVALRLEYWDFVQTETLDRLFPDGYPGIDLEHASLLETSMMLLVRPDLVDMSKIPNDGPAEFPKFDRYPTPPGLVPASGVLARAQGSTAEKGEWLLTDHVNLITEAISAEFSLQTR